MTGSPAPGPRCYPCRAAPRQAAHLSDQAIARPRPRRRGRACHPPAPGRRHLRLRRRLAVRPPRPCRPARGQQPSVRAGAGTNAPGTSASFPPGCGPASMAAASWRLQRPVGGSPSGTRRPGGRPPCPLTGLVTGERNHEELVDRGFAMAAVTAKYLNGQRLRLVSSWTARARRGRLQTKTRTCR